jgi:hypothetical protein
MLKRWHENRPFTFGAVFIFFYMTLPILDAYFIYPTMKPHCNGQITDQQIRACTDWIRKKETNHVRTTKRGYGGLSGNPSSDGYLREQERAITDFGRKWNP